MKPFIILTLVSCLLIASCHEKSIDAPLSPPPTQRIASLSMRYVRQQPQDPILDTVHIKDIVYPIVARDSLSFSYDAQDRLITSDRLQWYTTIDGPQINGGNGIQHSIYSYQGDRFLEVEGSTRQSFYCSLDSAQRRVLSRNKKRYSYVDVDTLRQYSTEGMLVSMQGPGYRQVFVIENGNVTRIEQYRLGSSNLEMLTRLVYDNKHYAPLTPFTFLGETSRNALLRKTILSYYPDGTHTDEYTYQNQYDNQGRMTRQVEYQQLTNYNQGKPYLWLVTDYYY
jgi:hypothetical protein